MANLVQVLILVIFSFFVSINSLDNGLVRTPPMGWLSWERFTCNIDCVNYPNDCINEQLYRDMADRLASDGYRDVGYEFVNIDDCWAEKQRDPQTNRLVADKKRFPSGIKDLADYVHSKRLKLGIYGDIGTMTCGGYPGTRDKNGTEFDRLDAITYAEWDVDSLKLDGCYADTNNFTNLYPQMEIALNSTNRSIVYSCSWPAYQIGENPDYDKIAKYCNLWRNFDDIEDSWESVTSIIDFYANNTSIFSKYNGPGAWNDPDMLIIGNFGLSHEQSKAQMALWAIWSAPLLMSNDLRQISQESKKILQNKHLIAVNQDVYGIMGKKVLSDKSGIDVWVKPISPIVNRSYTYVIVYLNRRTLGGPVLVSRNLTSLISDISTEALYYIYDLYEDAKLIGKLSSDDLLTLKVNGSGGVRVVKVSPNFHTQIEPNITFI